MTTLRGDGVGTRRGPVDLPATEPSLSANYTESHQLQDVDAGRRLAAIVESSDDAIISKDLNGRILTWNQSAQQIFGYTAEEAIGRSITMLIPPGSEDEEIEILSKIRRGERVGHYETIRSRKDGSLVSVSLTVSPVRDVHNRIVGASKIARDITERKRADEELRAARRELANLNAELEKRVADRTAALTEAVSQLEAYSHTVSHDLRAPIRAMRGFAKVVLEDHADELTGEGRDYLHLIVQGGERMDQLIQDMLDYSRTNRRDLRLVRVDLGKIIKTLVRQVPDLSPERAEIHVEEPLLPVLAHEPSLMQAVFNLLTNAVKFVAPGNKPRINIHSEKLGSSVRLWVEDNGIGIQAEDHERVFSMFERGHSGTAVHYEGTGVGLAIVSNVVKKMSGSVGVESDGQSGARFWIELPAARAR